MELLDIHTHDTGADKGKAIFNSPTYLRERKISMGIHPWYISEEWQQQFAIVRSYAYRENVVAIGECGIDKLGTTGTEIQIELFRHHAILAEEIKKPLIIHCVKGFDEILSVQKEIVPQQAWIIHGFRGKPQQAEQLTRNGLYLSFGEKFNIDSVKKTPTDRLFIESDESHAGISNIYSDIAKAKDCPVEELAFSVMKNAERCNIIL